MSSQIASQSSMGISRLVLLGLTLFFVLFPLTLGKPGVPLELKADEPGYYMMAMSLWYDGDLRCENEDLERLFHEFPLRTSNLHLMSRDGWQTAHFSAPILYSVLAAPVVGAFGANGMVSLNAALLMATIWIGASYLKRFNGEALATLYAAAFMLLSSGFAYVFWLQPEVLHMFCVAAAFALVFGGRYTVAAGDARKRWTVGSAGLVAGAAALLMVVVYAKPPFALLAIPLLAALLKDRGWRAAALWIAGAALSVALVAGLSWRLTGEPWPYLTGTRRAVNVSSPIEFAERKLSGVPTSVDLGREPAARGERWLEGMWPGTPDPALLLRNLGYFLWGRHVGLLLYMPFAVLSVGLWAAHGRRSGRRWALVLSIAAASVAFMAYFPSVWHGGGGFVGNRYLVNVYPAFLFLVTTISPPWLPAVGFAAAGIFLGQVFFTPLGVPVREPTLQAHARNAPFRYFPLELSLLHGIPGYRGVYHSGGFFQGRADVFQAVGDEMWFHGATEVEAWVTSSEPLEDASFEVRSGAPRNRISLCLGKDCETVRFEGADDVAKQEILLRPGDALWRRPGPTGSRYIYRLRARTLTGEQPRWRLSSNSEFYLGAALTYLGSSAERKRDLYHAEWRWAEVPPTVVAGGRFLCPIRVRNTSADSWPEQGATRVSLSYHWLTETGERVVWDGRRTALARSVAAGEILEQGLVVVAPDGLGDYRLVLDLVRERVDWFSVRDPAAGLARQVRVVEPEAAD